MADFADGDDTVNYQNSGLFNKLPAELRDRIYDLVLISGQMFVHYYASENPMVQPPITRCCRAMRSEALPIFYSINAFFIGVRRDEGTAWARIGARNRRHLGKVYVYTRAWDQYLEKGERDWSDLDPFSKHFERRNVVRPFDGLERPFYEVRTEEAS